jgi:hypothetical protein
MVLSDYCNRTSRKMLARHSAIIYDACQEDDEEDTCENAEDECFEECKHLLAGDRMNQGTPYRSCRIACLKRKGCYRGDMAVE